MTVAGIVLAGGSGTRLQREVNKVFLPLLEREMLAYSLDTMDRSPRIGLVVLVTRDEDQESAERLVARIGLSKPVETVVGGATRHQSEHKALEALADRIDSGRVDVVVIHDGARPFMTMDLLHATVDAAERSGGGVPALPIEAPVYERTEDGLRARPQRHLRRVQTPQAFRARSLLASYRMAEQQGTEGVDTAETVGRYTDLRVEAVPGDPSNLKVTFVEDIFRAEERAAAFSRGVWTD